jgi:hypothetical protein
VPIRNWQNLIAKDAEKVRMAREVRKHAPRTQNTALADSEAGYSTNHRVFVNVSFSCFSKLTTGVLSPSCIQLVQISLPDNHLALTRTAQGACPDFVIFEGDKG